MNPKPNQYLNLKPQGSQKFHHRRIHTELQDPSATKYTKQWLQNKKQQKVVESMRYIPTSSTYYPSKYQNKETAKQGNKEQDLTDQQLQKYSSSSKLFANHRRTKTGIEAPVENKAKNNFQPKKTFEHKNTFASHQNLKTQGDAQQQNIEKDQFAHKQSRFNRMKLEFSKYQASTAGTMTPNGAASRNVQHKYAIEGIAGKGTFGVVYFGRVRLTGEKIAIKKVLQDKRYKNRELQILKMLDHENLLKMKDHFFTVEANQQQYLNVIMDYYPDNLYQIIKKKLLTPELIRIFSYQILKGLQYLDSKSIAHRDIKPQNILVDVKSKKIVICDFGSAKKLVPGETNISYICSRCYRAPQLIFGATQYSPKIDIWSVGCVIVQMINGEAPFLGDSQLDQLLEIIKILGTPFKNEIQEMNPEYNLKDYKKFPSIKAIPWHKILKCSDPLLIDLVKKLLQYSPLKRLSAKQAIQHPYFDELNPDIHNPPNSNSQQNIEIDLNPTKITISSKNGAFGKDEKQPSKLSYNENIESSISAKAKISSLSSQIRKQKEEANKNQEDKKYANSGQYNINIMNHSGDSNININIHNININPDSQRDFTWQKHRLLSNNTRNNLERVRKLKDEMINNAQGDGKVSMKTGVQGEHQIRPINFSNIGMSKMGGHARMKSDMQIYQNEGNTERTTVKKEQKPVMFYKNQFSNN